MLKLDYNPEIGNIGVAILAESLRKNKVLSMVSLAYCGITAEGARALFEVLIYQGSQCELINLSGNQFGNEGIIPIFKGLAAAKSLLKVQLCDCGWEDTEEVMEAIQLAFSTNKKLARYDFRFNLISEEAVDKFISELVPNNQHIQDIELSTVISDDARAELAAAFAANKPKKGKGGKGKKKKK